MAGPSQIADVVLDVLLSEREAAQVLTTEHPVESGADPTDHARDLPIVLVLEGILSSLPTAEEVRANEVAPRGATSSFAGQQFEKLRTIKSTRQTVTVKTTSRTYDNMMMTELARVRGPALGPDTIQFTASFKEIRFVNTESVRLEAEKKPTAVPKKPTGNTNQGKKTGDDEDDRSILKSMSDAGGLTKAGDGTNR